MDPKKPRGWLSGLHWSDVVLIALVVGILLLLVLVS
jgi:hypothetical protein